MERKCRDRQTYDESTDESIYSMKYAARWWPLLKWEFTSWLGRTLLSGAPPLSCGTNLLNLGCGTAARDGFINADFFVLRGRRPEWMLDARFPLKCAGAVFDGVFSEHLLEHLYPSEGRRLLSESLRTLKPGAWLRVAVPDLRKYVDYYQGATVSDGFQAWETGCEAIRSLSQNWGHRSLWDSTLLGRVLRGVGFTEVKEVQFGEGVDRRLCIERDERRWESLYMEARKPR